MDDKTWYLCYPPKNTECNKKSCRYNPNAINPQCMRTSNEQCAVTWKDSGKPVLYSEYQNMLNALIAQDVKNFLGMDET